MLSLFGLSAASVALLVHELRNAPVAYEDHNGFHIVDKPSTGFKTWLFKHPPVANDNREEAAVPAEKHTVKARREVGSVTSVAL